MKKKVLVFAEGLLLYTERTKSFHLSIGYKGKHIEGEAQPVNMPQQQEIPLVHKLVIEGKDYGTIRCTKENWSGDKIKDPELEKTIGSYIHAWYE